MAQDAAQMRLAQTHGAAYMAAARAAEAGDAGWAALLAVPASATVAGATLLDFVAGGADASPGGPLAIELYTRAYECFKKCAANRTMYLVAREMARVHAALGNDRLALQILHRLARPYRSEQWWPLLHDVLGATVAAAARTGDVGVTLQALAELATAPLLLEAAERQAHLNALRQTLAQNPLHAVAPIAVYTPTCLARAGTAFVRAEGAANEPLRLQITLVLPTGRPGAGPLALSEFSGLLVQTSLPQCDVWLRVGAGGASPGSELGPERFERVPHPLVAHSTVAVARVASLGVPVPRSRVVVWHVALPPCPESPAGPEGTTLAVQRVALALCGGSGSLWLQCPPLPRYLRGVPWPRSPSAARLFARTLLRPAQLPVRISVSAASVLFFDEPSPVEISVENASGSSLTLARVRLTVLQGEEAGDDSLNAAAGVMLQVGSSADALTAAGTTEWDVPLETTTIPPGGQCAFSAVIRGAADTLATFALPERRRRLTLNATAFAENGASRTGAASVLFEPACAASVHLVEIPDGKAEPVALVLSPSARAARMCVQATLTCNASASVVVTDARIELPPVDELPRAAAIAVPIANGPPISAPNSQALAPGEPYQVLALVKVQESQPRLALDEPAPSVALGHVVYNWRRADAPLSAECISRVPLPPYQWQLPQTLEVRVDAPASTFVYQPFVVRIVVANLADSLLADLQVSMEPAEGMTFCGTRAVSLTLLPGQTRVFSLTSVATAAGEISLPRVRVISSAVDDSGVGSTATAERQQVLFDSGAGLRRSLLVRPRLIVDDPRTSPLGVYPWLEPLLL